MHTIFKDLRHALRIMKKNPGYTVLGVPREFFRVVGIAPFLGRPILPVLRYTRVDPAVAMEVD